MSVPLDGMGRPSRRWPGALLRGAALAALVVAAAALRLYDVNWDQFQHVHPDERFIVWVADTLSWPGSLAEALDPERSTINPFRWPPADPAKAVVDPLAGQPRNYAYGHFPLYLLVVTAHLAEDAANWLGRNAYAFPGTFQPLHTVGRQLASYDYLPLVGRVLSALADLGTLILVYLLARRLVRSDAAHPDSTRQAQRVAEVIPLLAAAAYAFAVLPIQLSHFAAVDALLAFCVTATVALAAGWADRAAARAAARAHSRWSSWLIWLSAGALAGLAVGSKFSAILLALPLVAAALYGLPAASRPRQLAVIIGRLAAAGAAALLVFALTNPFALIEFGAYVRQIMAQNTMVSGRMDAPYTRQYIGTLPYLYFIQQLSQWGLGWPLGVAAWGGFIWAVVQFVRRRASPALAVMLAWALPYFTTTGAFQVKFLRYMAPLLPFLLVFGAGAAWAALRVLARRWPRRGRAVWAGLAAAAIALTVAWALAFLGVYRHEHPWIQASRWIYQHIPEGSKLLSEHWDDALPLTLDNLPGGRPHRREYVRVELPLWDPDSPEKLDLLVAELSTADFIVLASDRLSAPMQRLGVRYPMTHQYYRLLLAGELGYQPVAEFTAYPHLGRWVVRDDWADESFYVYDHPRTLVLQNVERLPASLLRSRLGRYLPLGAGDSDVVAAALHPGGRVAGLARMLPQAPAPDAPLTLSQPVDTLPVVADFRWNRAASASAPLAVALWWLALSLFGWLVWPLLFSPLRGLADRGYGLARAAGWLLVGWIHWMGASLGAWQNRLAPLALIVSALLLAGVIALGIQRRQIAAFCAQQRRLLLGQEALFAAAYLAFAGVRLLNPDLWQPWNGGEKFMEFAFLNAILRSPSFPPYDPYFAGGIINYYYYGLYLVSLPIKLTGIFPEVAFNLAVPGLFALTALGVFSVSYSMAPARWRRRAALLSVALALLMGNLSGLSWLLDAFIAALRGAPLPGYDYWGASRVIPYTINEFPLWTFTFADLHPHMIAMPFGMLVAGLVLNRLRAGDQRPRFVTMLPWIVLSLGSLGAINTWDLPTYALLVVAGFLVAAWRVRPAALIGGAGQAILAVGLAVAAYWPFFANYRAQVGSGGGSVFTRFLAWTRAASPLGDWLNVWGLFLLLAFSYVVVAWVRSSRRDAAEQPAAAASGAARPWLLRLLALVALLAILAAAGRPTAALAALPLTLALPLVFRRRAAAGDVFTALLLVLGLGIAAGIELVYLRDFLEGGEWYRMNTLFKFSVPAWLLLATAGGLMVCRTWAAAGRASPWLGLLWRAGMSMALAAGLVFLAVGIPKRVDDRFPGARPEIGTLDATAYMTVGRYTWPNASTVIDLRPEREAIQWLLANVRGAPVIAEAPAGGYTVAGEFVGYDYYRAGGLRVASLTGFPTFVGQHQSEQRPGDQVWPRTEEGREFFETTDLARTRVLIRSLRVGYIYLGPLERILFSAESLDKFDALVASGDLAVVYRNEAVTIYQVSAGRE